MFGRPSGYEYRALPQKDAVLQSSPGLYVSAESIVQCSHAGSSFDYVPRISENDFTDRSQSWLSWVCHLIVTFLVFVFTVVTFPVSAWFVLKVVPNYERIVAFRLGRVRPPKGPGVVLVLPFIEQWQRVDLRTRAFNIPPCQVTTKDGGLVSVGADIQFRIWNPVMSVVAVQDLNASTRLTAQNSMTHRLLKKTVQEIQLGRTRLGEDLQVDINEKTRPWGLEVHRVELTVESVLKTPENSPLGPLVLPPSVPGLEGLTGPIQQLAMHFLGSSGVSMPSHSKGDTVSFVDEKRPVVPAREKHCSADELLATVKSLLSERLVSQVGACFQFNIRLRDGLETCYFVDLSKGSGRAGAGVPDRIPDIVLQMSEEDLLAMFEGSLRPFAAYTSGRLAVQGDLKVAMKLEEVIKEMRQQERKRETPNLPLS
ncbi:stomatin-like protein 1 [Lepisosteus oculatus]|uniref:stomatin-like protein 1 n=1 Tax=Lepisosteus oculatus TaxID=7918 RepID=UPI00371A23D1